jgi:hypothetical protein
VRISEGIEKKREGERAREGGRLTWGRGEGNADVRWMKEKQWRNTGEVGQHINPQIHVLLHRNKESVSVQ